MVFMRLYNILKRLCPSDSLIQFLFAVYNIKEAEVDISDIFTPDANHSLLLLIIRKHSRYLAHPTNCHKILMF